MVARPARCTVGLVCAALLAVPAAGSATTLEAAWSGAERRVSARFDDYWSAHRNALRMDRGWLYARNDAERLYLLVDVTADTGRDPSGAGQGGRDYLSLVVDVDRDGEITPKRDVAYGLHRGTHRLGLQRFVGPGRLTGLQSTRARVAAGFGATPASRRPHRLWELAIPLDEIGARAGGAVHIGLRVHSARPGFTDELPRGHYRRFADLVRVELAGRPMIVGVLTARREAASARIAERRPGAVLAGRLDPKALAGLRPRVVLQPGMGGASADCPLPEGEPVERRIRADGAVELVFANGSSKRRGPGGWSVYCPDGSQAPIMVTFSTQIPPTLPPTLPDEAQAEWLAFHANRLLGIIGGLVDDGEMVQRYLDSEGADWSVYRRIQERGETINYLVAE